MHFFRNTSTKIAGTLSCVDRIVFKGYLPISRVGSFESFLARNQCLIKDFQPFVQKLSAQVKTAAQQAARASGSHTARAALCLKTPAANAWRTSIAT